MCNQMIPYDEYGSREHPTVLLLHGAAALNTFCCQYCLSSKYHLIVPHLCGAGKLANRAYDPEWMKRELFVLIAGLHKEKIGIIGHSLGAQLAVMLLCERPERFCFAVFLSAWVNPTAKAIRRYCRFAGLAAGMLHCKWLVRLQGRYWRYTKAQADDMAAYAASITLQVYRSFFENTLDLKRLPTYATLDLPMLAICGSGEVVDMKTSLALLGENAHCRTLMLSQAGHDFPMRRAEALNPILEAFIERFKAPS